MPDRPIAESLYSIRELDVLIGGDLVGRMAQPSPKSPVYFEYSPEWLASGYSISPFSLLLEPGVQEPPHLGRTPMHGIFVDSLPDDWGKLVVDRKLARDGVDPALVGPLARLALVGASGRGALEYRPAMEDAEATDQSDFDRLCMQSQALLERDSVENLDDLYRRGGSSGGARPKVMVEIDGEAWLVKFPFSRDDPDECVEEYRISDTARKCGLNMPETRLLPSAICGGFFAVRRFDRQTGEDGGHFKIHMASACALLEANPFEETIDYRDLMKLSMALTSDARDSEQLYRLMCFNVLIGNCDDHIRNFSFLCADGRWRLSPAYDLTRNAGFFGEHSVLVNGKGRGITDADLIAVGEAGSISPRKAKAILEEVREEVLRALGRFDSAYNT